MTDVAAPKKRRRPAPFIAAGAVAALAVVLTLIARGWHAEHWWPVAAFLLVAAGGTTFELAGNWLTRRRARRFRSGVPRNVVLRAPRWSNSASWLVWTGAGVGAIPAAIGFPGVGLGLAMAIAGFSIFGMTVMGRLQPGRLTFETAGLRLGSGRVSFLVPWTAITNTELMGSNTVWLCVVSAESISAVEPDTPGAREKAREMVMGVGPDSRIMLRAWAGGMDTRTLIKAIEEAKTGQVQALN
jgi:hypothetical protein